MSLEKSTQIFIARLHPRVTERDLKSKFEKYGDVRDVVLKKGYAFLNYEDPDCCEKAVEKMNGKEVEGQEIVVQHSSKNKNFKNQSLEQRDLLMEETRGQDQRINALTVERVVIGKQLILILYF